MKRACRHDRLQRSAAGRVLLPLGALAVLGAAAWGVWPLEKPRVEMPDLKVATATERIQPAELDADAFRAPLWIVAAPPPEPPAPAAPPAPLKLQLLAILREGGTRKAAIYDPDSDRIVVARGGDTIAGQRVESVLPDAVELREGELLRRLALDEREARP